MLPISLYQQSDQFYLSPFSRNSDSKKKWDNPKVAFFQNFVKDFVFAKIVIGLPPINMTIMTMRVK